MKRVIACVLAYLLGALPAAAVDFTMVLTDYRGQPLNDCPQDKPDCGQQLTLGTAAAVALSVVDERLPEGEKFRRGQLADKIYKAKDDLKLTAEEIALVKKAIDKVYTPVVVWRAWSLLDPAAAQPR